MQRTTSSTASQDPVASTTPVTLLRFHPGRILSESTQGLMKASAAAIHDEPAKEYIPVRGLDPCPHRKPLVGLWDVDEGEKLERVDRLAVVVRFYGAYANRVRSSTPRVSDSAEKQGEDEPSPERRPLRNTNYVHVHKNMEREV